MFADIVIYGISWSLVFLAIVIADYLFRAPAKQAELDAAAIEYARETGMSLDHAKRIMKYHKSK